MSEAEAHSSTTSKYYDRRLFASLLTPSTLSAVVSVLVSLLVVGSIVAITSYRGSSLQRDFLSFQRSQTNKTTDNELELTEEDIQLLMAEGWSYQEIQSLQQEASLEGDYGQVNDNFANSTVVRNLTVMIFWMFVGLFVYFMITGISGALGEARLVGDELHYMHARRKQLLHEVYIKTLIRLVTLGCWLAFILLFTRIILPYVLAAAHIGGGNITSLQGLGYSVLAFAVLLICIHAHLVMLRLTLLRPRLFSQETSF